MKLTLIAIIFLFLAPAGDKLVKTKVGNDIVVNLPESFFPMSPADIAQRYPSVRQPIGAFTNEDRLVDFSINISATRWRSSDIEIAKDFFKASITNLYDRVDYIDEGIREVNGLQYIYFEFDSRINGDKYTLDQRDSIRRYTYLMYLLINGKTIVISFNSPLQLKENWVEVAPEIMNSLKVKSTI